ncbi:MAG: histidine phosphatase family protein, partial [Rhodobacteraceae bacterium]|nr:histidine phosphatase family protein [Paracoccaceae bacterium]
MRRLILMRHAKSSWADPEQPDFERPLNSLGKRGAAAVGAWLAERGIVPQAALVSASVRTQETWAQLGPAFADVPMTPLQGLYH